MRIVRRRLSVAFLLVTFLVTSFSALPPENVALSIGPADPLMSVSATATDSKLRLDRAKYMPTNDCFVVTVTDADQDVDPQKPDTVRVDVLDAYPTGAATGDQEEIVLTETGYNTGVFTSACIPLAQGSANKGDGTLQVNPGDIIAAAYQDPDNPQTAQTAQEFLDTFDISLDLALISGGQPTGKFQIEINPDILPQNMTSTPGSSQNEPNRPLAVVVNPDNVPVFFGEDQLLYHYTDPQERDAFLQERGGTLVEEVTITEKSQSGSQTKNYALVRINPAQGDLNDFAYLAELFGVQGKYIFSSENAARLMGIVLEDQVAGRFVMHNPVVWALGPPRTSEGDLDGDGSGGDDGLSEFWFQDADVGLGRAITYLDLIDRNRERAVNAAFVDGGFASPADFGSSTPHPDFGVSDFASIPQGDCTDSSCSGSAGGSFPIGGFCAGGGGLACDWHGTLAFSVAGAVANNGAGAIGVAGHARNPTTGQDGAGGLINPMFYKIGLPYMTNAARAINKATDDGATLINLSNGFACEPFLDIDICKTETRIAVLAACEVGRVVLSILLPSAITSLLSQVACGALVAFFELSGVADEDALHAAVNRALADPNRVVIASGPENATLPVIGEVGPFDALDDEFYPCAYEGVLCVGALADTKAPMSINPIGSGIDIWAPGMRLRAMPVPGSSGITSFRGTSAAAPFVTGVVAMMKSANASLQRSAVEEILKNTSRSLSSAASGGCVNKPDGSGCVGFVDVLAAVREAANLPSVACTGWEEVTLGSNDTQASATDLGTLTMPIRGSNLVSVTVTQDGAIHALNGSGSPTDVDWFRFRVSSSGWARVELTVPFATDNLTATLYTTVTASTYLTIPLTTITDPSVHGWYAEMAVDPYRNYYLSITADAPGGLNDTCYNGTTLVIKLIRPPDPDVTEAGGGTSADAPYRIPGPWEHHHFEECTPELRRRFGTDDCSTVFENGADARVRSAVERWSLVVPDLSLHTPYDRDFFRIPPLPDPGDPADGGHDDIRPSAPPHRPPDPEPLQECGLTQREELGLGSTSNTIDVSMGGALIIEVQPLDRFRSDRTSISTSERLYVYRDLDGDGHPERDESLIRREGPFRVVIDCPRSRHGLSDLVFSFGERGGSTREAVELGRYRLRIEYRIEINRALPTWVGEPGTGRPPRLPCTGPLPFPGPFGRPADFPFCPQGPGNPVEIEATHPLDPSNPRCLADGPGCPEPFLFDWPGGDLNLSFRSDVDLSFKLYNEDQTLIGEAGVVPGTANGTGGSFPLGFVGTGLRRTTTTKSLSVPQLDAGLYVLVVEGANAAYTVTYTPLEVIRDVYLPVVIR